MFYQEYLVAKAYRESLRKKFAKEKERQNQPVTIHELVVYPENDNYSYGEAKAHGNKYSSDIATLPRLVEHIKSLATIANLYHQQTYCELTEEGKYELKKENYNHITRLSLSEFSLYGKEALTIEEFGTLLEIIEKIAMQTHDNVHLLLSSFSVINKQGSLLNVSLYVQGGIPPKIDTISKGQASLIDVRYDNATNFSQQLEGHFTSNVSSYVAVEGDAPINNNSLLEIETKGGARYIQTIDICLDHANLHSKRLMQARLQNPDEYSFTAEQVDQILSSNSIYAEDEAKVASSVLHVDPRPEFFDKDNATRPLDEIKLDAKNSSKINRYPDMEVSVVTGGLNVKNPPFGSDYRLRVYQERQLGSYHSSLKEQVKAMNQRVMERRLDSIMETRYVNGKEDVKTFHEILDVCDKSFKTAANLLQQLSQSCKPNFIEYLFGTRSYYLKKEAKAVIAASAAMLKGANNDANDFLIMAMPWIKDLKFKLELIDDGLPHHFIKEMTTLVDKFQQQMTMDIVPDLGLS
ncbi:hypothetical protein [Legionella cardiaca]|uniref:Uncharacterized protein n=1 Tax=Legionella cardiaca TaxID=1071983 RepID=A0ABY8AUB4_9GAMM|nr:hypothetical protein [Legionella cardiaca]WED44083.1 hypothetical protein PXX05_04660 [Legionella cardiaca]